MLKGISNGNINIFTNEATKIECEGKNTTPTHESILSRLNRFNMALICIACQMARLNKIIPKGGSPTNEYLAGSDMMLPGFVAMVNSVEEDINRMVSSNAIYQYLKEVVPTWWVYKGTFTYLVYDVNDLSNITTAVSGDTAVVQNGADGTNQIYEWSGVVWGTQGELLEPENFNWIELLKESNTTIGHVSPNDQWYWFGDSWQNTTSSADEALELLAELEAVELKTVKRYDGNGHYKLAIASYGLSDSAIIALFFDSTTDVIVLMQDAEPVEVILTGNPITLSVGDIVTNLALYGNTQQEGTGDPSSTNIRPISGTASILINGTTQIAPAGLDIYGQGGKQDSVDETGAVVRKFGVYIMTGDEALPRAQNADGSYRFDLPTTDAAFVASNVLANIKCTHLKTTTYDAMRASAAGAQAICTWNGDSHLLILRFDSSITTTEQAKAYVKSQYDAGTPIKIVYELSVDTTDTTTEIPLDQLRYSGATLTASGDMRIVTQRRA